MRDRTSMVSESRVARWTAFVMTVLTLTACAPRPSANVPNVDSLEYKISWGLIAVNAEPAFRKGASGRGVTIALIDCGVEQSDPEFVVNLSSDSVDLNPDRKLP